MQGPFADRLFRIAFTTAGCYNLAFGLWAAIWPLAFFEWFNIPAPRYPGIWACLGMVVGVYGLLYLHAARRFDAAWPIIAVGLLGKVLGPIGMITSFGDDWPRRLGMVCVYNDLVWWLPFGLFLVRGTALGNWLAKAAPQLCVLMHVLALAMLGLFLRHGALTVADVVTRAQYVAAHPTIWSLGWATWMAAAASLVGFYAWWGSQLSAKNVATIAVVISALGMVCDFSGEGLLSLLLVERAASVSDSPFPFQTIERCFTLLSAGAANGLYTVAGILLTLATPNVPSWVRAAMWITWLAGIGMTLAALMNHVGGMVVTTVILFPLLLAWIAWMGIRWRKS